MVGKPECPCERVVALDTIALCSDFGPLLLRSSSVGVSGVPNPPALCLKQASQGWSNFIDYRSKVYFAICVLLGNVIIAIYTLLLLVAIDAKYRGENRHQDGS
jgi:hypothetical protein